MSFVYDALGNRRRTVSGGTVTYQTNSLNRYTSVGGTVYTNDANDAPVASHAYGYLGRRVSRRIYGAPDATIRYTCDGDRIITEYDGSGTLPRKFVYGPGIDERIRLIDVADSKAVYYYRFDSLGSVVALCDANGVPVERYAYDVFGRATGKAIPG